MRAMLILLVSTPAAAQPMVGARVGAHETEQEGQASFGPLAEIEGGLLVRGVAITGLVRVDRRGRVDSGTHSCAEAGPLSMQQCPWTMTTAQTDVALGLRARARIAPRLWIGATAGVMRDFESVGCVGSEGACSDGSTSYDAVFGETSVGYALPVEGSTLELAVDVGYAYFASYGYDASSNAKWFGLSIGVRR
jgi:hypothetical protein